MPDASAALASGLVVGPPTEIAGVCEITTPGCVMGPFDGVGVALI